MVFDFWKNRITSEAYVIYIIIINNQNNFMWVTEISTVVATEANDFCKRIYKGSNDNNNSLKSIFSYIRT